MYGNVLLCLWLLNAGGMSTKSYLGVHGKEKRNNSLTTKTMITLSVEEMVIFWMEKKRWKETLERKHARKTLTERKNHPQSRFIVVNSDSTVAGTYALTHKKM